MTYLDDHWTKEGKRKYKVKRITKCAECGEPENNWQHGPIGITTSTKGYYHAFQIQPDWLKRITSGLAEGRKVRLLIDGKNYAVVQSPGGYWFDNSGKHYGPTSYTLVDKRGRSGDGLVRDGKSLKEGGRITQALLVEWKALVERADAIAAAESQPL